MTKKELLQKIAKFEIDPGEAEEVYEGTNLYGPDREQLKSSFEKIKSNQKGLKKFLMKHPALASLGSSILGAGVGLGVGKMINQEDSIPIGAAIGGTFGALTGGIGSAGVRSSVTDKTYKDFEENNPDFMNRYYTNPDRYKFRNDKERNDALKAQADAIHALGAVNFVR